MTSINDKRREALAKRILGEVDLVTLVASFDPLERNQGEYAYGLEMQALIREAKKLVDAEGSDAPIIQMRVDPEQNPVRVEPDIDIYVDITPEVPEPETANGQTLQFKFTHEGLIIDVFDSGMCEGTSSETYEEIHERLSDACFDGATRSR